MAINTAFQIAGISGGGASGAEPCWFAQGGTAPTDATTALITTAASCVQTVTMTATSGNWTVSYNGVTTAAQTSAVTTSALATAITGLSTVGTGNVTVTGTAGSSYVITFAGSLANQAVSTFVLGTGALVGGTATVAVTTAGSSGWLSGGLVSEDGVAKDVKENSKEIRSFGVATATRKIVTSSDVTLKLTLQETNKVSAAVYNRKPLGSISPVGGAFTITDGAFAVARYQFVADVVDGLAKVRMYCPNAEVTDRGGFAIKAGEIISYDTTLTAYPDSTGVAVYTYFVVPGLT